MLNLCVFSWNVLNLCVFREHLVILCVFSWKCTEFFGKSTNSTHGKRASFSQNSQKWHPFFLTMFVFRRHLMNDWKNLQILPMGNVRHFRRIRKNDTLFLRMCVFCGNLVNLCAFRGNLVNYLGNLQNLPMGNVRNFRRIHKNDTPFLKTCVFFT